VDHDAAQDELGALWGAVRARLQASVPESTFRLWLEPLRVAGVQGGTLFLSAPDGIRAWVERRYSSLIREALADTALRDVSFAEAGEQAEGGRAPEIGLYTARWIASANRSRSE
jgi:chromosomal replication initiation ATPase DnaA